MKSVLVANRGEIAVRVIRACREMGLRSIAVYSEPDRASPHVFLADEAQPIGPAPSSESYLRIDRILEAARRSGADAVHPGYGFLAERAEFADAVAEAGLIFVGPDGATIAAMGNKSEARRRMSAAGVPVVPGTEWPVEHPDDAIAFAEKVGFPVLLKAVAGGGGKGMRSVNSAEEVPRALEAARREAQGAFGDDAVYVEKYLTRPRHIEIQILGDAHGSAVHFGERECSIQRRHQKLVEEAPSPVITESVREAMGRAAVRAAQSVGYRGAGTVEFLYQDGSYFFLEMNTRIQVEHPVTELVCGIDLVQWQLRVGAGEPLAFDQEEIEMRGHAIECRITSEDPAQGFLPSTGSIRHLELPSGPGVRWDGGIASGFQVGLHYDPLLGKLIVHAPTRSQAIARMARALDELVIHGLSTDRLFLRRVMDEPDFRAGDLSVRYLEEHPALLAPDSAEGDPGTIAAIAALLEAERRKGLSPPRIGVTPLTMGLSAWKRALHPHPEGS